MNGVKTARNMWVPQRDEGPKGRVALITLRENCVG